MNCLEMGLSGKIVEKVEILKDAGDVLFELFGKRPHEIPTITPHKIHGCALHAGDWGQIGSTISWDFTRDGKRRVIKEVIEVIDDEKKTVKFKVSEAEVLELYKNFIITIHVQTHGVHNLVTWIMEYEKLNETVPDPTNVMEFALHLTKDIESHHHHGNPSKVTNK